MTSSTDEKNGNVSVSKKDISGSFDGRESTLSSEITHIKHLIDSLISHKITIENANRMLEQLANAEQDRAKKAKYYTAIQNNIDLLTRVFHAISELEIIKFRYHKEIDEILTNKLKLIAVDIRRIEEKIGNNDEGIFTFFEKLNSALTVSTGGKSPVTAVSEDLKKDRQYEM